MQGFALIYKRFYAIIQLMVGDDMIMMYLLFLLSLIVCRFFSGYDSRFQNGKYIIINSPKLRMLLVDEMSFFERKKRLKKDINKMTISGLFFYIYSLATLILSVLLYIIVPKIPIEPWEIETDNFFMYVDTFNEKLSAICIWLFFLSIISYVAVLMVRHTKTVKQRWIRILIYIVSSIMLVAVAFILFEMIRELISCFI